MTDIPTLRAPTPEDNRSVYFQGKPPGWMPPPPSPSTSPLVNPGTGTNLSHEQQDAVAYLQALLDDYGLGSLSGWAYDQVVAGNSPEMVLQELRKTQEYKTRFHVIFERQAKGLSAISPAEVIAYERQGRQLMRSAGLPEGFYDSTDDMDAFLTEDVSLAELNDRIELAREWLYQTDPTTRAEMTRLYGEGALLAHAIDPDVAVPLISRQFTAARSAGAAMRSGYGALTRGEAERLADLGITPDAALRGFGVLVESEQLLNALPGEAGETIGRDAQLGAAFGGDARAQQQIERQRAQRKAQFSSGGQFASGREGFTGLGVAQ